MNRFHPLSQRTYPLDQRTPQVERERPAKKWVLARRKRVGVNHSYPLSQRIQILPLSQRI